MDPDQTSDLSLHCLSKWLPRTKVDDRCCIGALMVNKCNGQDFHEMHPGPPFAQLKHLINALPNR